MTSFYLGLAIAAGVAFALQVPINGELSRRLSSPLAASFVAYVVGASVAGIALLGACALRGAPTRDLFGAPAPLYLGGMCGAIGVILLTIAGPRIGTAATVSAITFGQVVFSLVVDRAGWFGMTPIPIDARRALGVVVMAVAVWLLRR